MNTHNICFYKENQTKILQITKTSLNTPLIKSSADLSLTHCSQETCLFVCVEVLQPNGAMSSTISLPNHKFTGQT